MLVSNGWCLSIAMVVLLAFEIPTCFILLVMDLGTAILSGDPCLCLVDSARAVIIAVSSVAGHGRIVWWYSSVSTMAIRPPGLVILCSSVSRLLWSDSVMRLWQHHVRSYVFGGNPVLYASVVTALMLCWCLFVWCGLLSTIVIVPPLVILLVSSSV